MESWQTLDSLPIQKYAVFPLGASLVIISGVFRQQTTGRRKTGETGKKRAHNSHGK